ncbi:MAG: DNA gyrase inhibitor YacG, partial [Planctomycetes bacterium]|nr:DNA gyrase inhibitor YacG [Planctomycetota bacterium]
MIAFTCPTCGRRYQVEQLEEATNRAFCCQRCRDIDL